MSQNHFTIRFPLKSSADAKAIADRGWRKFRDVLYKISHGAVINIGDDKLPENGTHPLVKNISACCWNVMLDVASMNVCAELTPSFSSFSAARRSAIERVRHTPKDIAACFASGPWWYF